MAKLKAPTIAQLKAMRKLIVVDSKGEVNRSGSIMAAIEKFGPRDDKWLTDLMVSFDDTLVTPLTAPTKQDVKNPALNRVQLQLYSLRNKGLAEKLESGKWAAA